MHTVTVQNVDGKQVLERLSQIIGGSINEEAGEMVLELDDEYGKGTFRHIDFDHGVSLLDCDIELDEALKLCYSKSSTSQLEFIFISEGNLEYTANGQKEPLQLERYQNIIISPQNSLIKCLTFPANIKIRANFIRIKKKEYFSKKNNNINYLNDVMLSIFNDREGKVPYNHLGTYSLKIADEINALNKLEDSGMIRSLSIEGRLYLILAMQLLEHHKFETEEYVPDSLSKQDIKKIHKLSDYALDHISEDLTLPRLSEVSGLSPKKLQIGFKLLYSKSVNAYIRHLKLEIARDQLKNTDLSISEIVYRIGFKSRSYFSKIFNEQYKILPTEYRNQLKKRPSAN